MLVLVVDTSTPAVTSAVARVVDSGVEVLAVRAPVDARAHGELLAPGVNAVLAEAGATAADLAAIVAGLGPGPFTGLRVGLVTAAALSQALAIPTYGVCSLDGIGTTLPGVALVATDARRREIYWAVYRDGKRLAGPAVNRPADMPALLAEHGLNPTCAGGDGVLRYPDQFLAPDGLGLPVHEPRFPQPAALAALAADRLRAGAPGEILTPLYLRRPDAIEPGTRKTVSQ